MATYSIQGTYTTGTNFTAALHNTELNAIATSLNNITNDQVSASAAIAISKTALGTFTPWTAWTSVNAVFNTLSMTITSQTCRYSQIGKIVYFKMDITKVTKCKCIKSIWNLNPGDITTYKIEKGIYYFLYVNESDDSIGWDSWMDEGNEEFLKYFELIDIDPSIIKPIDDLEPLLKLLKNINNE